MKIKKSELQRIIKEESAKKHPLSDLARRQGKTMGGNLADPEGFYALVKNYGERYGTERRSFYPL